MATMRQLTLTLDPNSLHAVRYLAERLEMNKSPPRGSCSAGP